MGTTKLSIVKLYLFLTIYLATANAALTKLATEREVISEIYIGANGNNKYEAQIRAHELGMRRSLKLLVDKMNLPTDQLKYVPYAQLKSIFTLSNIQNEKATADSYSATVSYSYNKSQLYNILLEYGTAVIDEKFYELVVLPVFKQGNQLNIWQPENKWNDYWQDARGRLNDYKIYYPSNNLQLTHKINTDNLFKLTHEDFVNIFGEILFKDVLIISAELFTDRATANSNMQITQYLLSPDVDQVETKQNDYLLRNWQDLDKSVGSIINNVIEHWGNLSKTSTEKSALQPVVIDEQEKLFMMHFEAFSPEEITSISNKLTQTEQVNRFVVEPSLENQYKILIYTYVSEYELTEGLYLNGLSYKQHGDLYNLIDVQKGS